MSYIIPDYNSDLECLFASNPYNSEFGERVAFLIASKAVHGVTADRTEIPGTGRNTNFSCSFAPFGVGNEDHTWRGPMCSSAGAP